MCCPKRFVPIKRIILIILLIQYLSFCLVHYFFYCFIDNYVVVFDCKNSELDAEMLSKTCFGTCIVSFYYQNSEKISRRFMSFMPITIK